MRRDRHVEDRPGAGLAHGELVRRLAHGQRPVDVQPLDGPPSFGCESLRRDHVLTAGVVQHHIKAAKSLEGRRHDLLSAGAIPDVTGDPRATLPQLRGRSLEHLRSAPCDHHVSAAARQLGRRRLAEIGAAAGDDRDPSFERAVDEDARRFHGYSPSTLITSRLDRRPSNSQ
jgi:hypothetical protein